MSDKYYVHGCRNNGEEGEIECCEDSKAQFWTLYERDSEGLSQGIIDCVFREDAVAAMSVYVERDRLNEQLEAAQRGSEYGDAYQGAREDLAIWKRRALEAEAELKRRDERVALARVNADQMRRVCLEANRHVDKYGAMATEVNKLIRRAPLYAAAPAALNSPVIPDGWVMVPTKASAAMIRAGGKAAREYLEEYGGNSPRVIYQAMLAAATAPGGGDA